MQKKNIRNSLRSSQLDQKLYILIQFLDSSFYPVFNSSKIPAQQNRRNIKKLKVIQTLLYKLQPVHGFEVYERLGDGDEGRLAHHAAVSFNPAVLPRDHAVRIRCFRCK